jgi:hypothetical protein
MGAAAGKQFQSEKAKHAQAVLSAVELFEQSNHQEQESYGGVSTEFFKKRVMLAASDAKRNGKDIEKSLAQLTDADMDMLAHYAENRKAEMRRQGAANSNTMQVEEIFDEENGNADNAGDNVDETTSVLSYGDDEEEAAENDEMDSSGEILENIEEVVESRPRLNSGFKVFPMGAEEEEEGASKADGENGGSNQKSKLKLEEATVRSGIADHFAKFWDYDEPGSLASQATHGAGIDSPLTGAHSPNSTLIGKKFQPSPKQSFPYKDRGQRIDERNEALMVLQRKKVISLTQNAQLEREVEALQRQLEKMDQIDQTFASTNKTNGSLNNTGNSSNTVPPGSTLKFAQMSARSDLSSSGYGSGNVQGRYSYIYPIDEEISFQPHEHRDRAGEHKKAESKHSAGSVSASNGNSGGGAGILNPHRRRKEGRTAKGGSSPSSSDNDSVNSYSNNVAGGGFNKNVVGNGNGSGKARAAAGASNVGDMRAQGKGGILRVKSNDQSDLSDDVPSAAPTQPVLSKVGKAHSSFASGGGAGGAAPVSSGQSGSSKPKRVRIGASTANEGDSDDSTQLVVQNSRHAGYNPSHPSNHPSLRNGGRAGDAAQVPAQAKHANESDSENHESNISRSTRPQVLKNKRVVSVGVRQVAQNASAQLDEADAKSRGSDTEVVHHDQVRVSVSHQSLFCLKCLFFSSVANLHSPPLPRSPKSCTAPGMA